MTTPNSLHESLREAGELLRQGGVVAYPTEGVFGLGCLPGDAAAINRIIAMKHRDPDMGLIPIASAAAQLAPYVAVPLTDEDLPSSLAHPLTWIVPAKSSAPPWIRGRHSGIAVRICRHPVAAALCDAAGSALVSTSANVSGEPATRDGDVLHQRFGHLVDCIVPGACGPAVGASEIRDFATGKVLRASTRPR